MAKSFWESLRCIGLLHIAYVLSALSIIDTILQSKPVFSMTEVSILNVGKVSAWNSPFHSWCENPAVKIKKSCSEHPYASKRLRLLYSLALDFCVPVSGILCKYFIKLEQESVTAVHICAAMGEYVALRKLLLAGFHCLIQDKVRSFVKNYLDFVSNYYSPAEIKYLINF